jgi:PAS domain S-box-containing protein
MLEDFETVLENTPILKSIFDNASANAVLVMDTEGYILDLNEAFTHSFGFKKEDLLGKHTRVLFTEEDQNRRMPEIEIEKVNQVFTAIDKNYTMHKDGSCIWVSGESILAKDKEGKRFIIKFIQNIHEQKVLEKFLKESTEFSESVVKSITDAILVFDTDLRILKANNAFYNLFQINQTNVEGLMLAEITHPLIRSNELKQHLDAMLATEASDQFQLEWKVNETQSKHYAVKASFIDGKLVNKRILLVISDVTKEVQSEQQRDDLVAFVIHELRNPLANIALCHTMIEESITSDDKEGADEYLKMSKQNSLRLKSLIQELYDATKAGSGNLQFNKTAFVFDDLVNEVIETIQLSNTGYNIVKKGSVNLVVTADRSRINQVFSNYLLNAIKYSPGSNKIVVEVFLENGNVVVSVTDFGKGIPAGEIDYLFERYYRSEKTNSVEGLGLGLFLSKKIIDAHNGRVWVTSKENKGSTFYFSIPVD